MSAAAQGGHKRVCLRFHLIDFFLRVEDCREAPCLLHFDVLPTNLSDVHVQRDLETLDGHSSAPYPRHALNVVQVLLLLFHLDNFRFLFTTKKPDGQNKKRFNNL